MAIDNGAATLAQVAKATGACTICGTCKDRIRGDATSANIFEDILSDEEEHIDYLETQQGLIGQLGEQLYLAQLVERPDD